LGIFKLISDYSPRGDQPRAISQLTDGILKGERYQTLLGATGSGKTFTMAQVIANVERPTLVMSPNKTLAAQLCSEFRSFFPENAVEYFVSYYDYYQPEAYVPQSDLYIEKDATINDDIDRLRHRATQALLARRDVVIVASVSCIYGLGSPEDYRSATLTVRKGEKHDRDGMISKLVEMKYERNNLALRRGKFRVKGDVVEICSVEENITRIELLEDTVERIVELNGITGSVIEERGDVTIFPATHFVTLPEKVDAALHSIEEELEDRLAELRAENKLVEAQRLEQKTKFDLEMIRETGYCTGIENYSRHFTDRKPGETPYTLIDFFPKDYLLVVDESHVTIPQVRGMYEGDRSRKDNLVDYGFRLPSAYDNRPLLFKEFEAKVNQVVYLSATPGPYELSKSEQIAEQIIRPTGLTDPEVIVRPAKGQIEDLVAEIRRRAERRERVLVTTLTKRMAEDLAEYLDEKGVKVRYLHSEIETLKRVELLRDLRVGEFDVLVGINLLREGLDLPEVSLVAILDADKEGYLRSETSLIQTIGRAARNVSGQVIMYADATTDSMRRAMNETDRRRRIQMDYNKVNKIKPESIRKEIRAIIEALPTAEIKGPDFLAYSKERIPIMIANLEQEMLLAAQELEFERAAKIRDKIRQLKPMAEKRSSSRGRM